MFHVKHCLERENVFYRANIRQTALDLHAASIAHTELESIDPIALSLRISICNPTSLCHWQIGTHRA